MTAAGALSNSRPELTALVLGARRGLRRDVALFEAALDDGELFLPLARGVDGANEGEATPLDREMELVPHFLSDPDGRRYAALFTQAELALPLARGLGWTTDGDELRVCTLPARVACQLSLDVIDEESVHGLVIDAGQPSELFLKRSELASLVAGQPLPLVGYVAELPPQGDERVLIAEPGDPLPAELTNALERCLASLAEVTRHRLEHSFNPERDLEPHLTLRLVAADDADRRAVAAQVIEAIGELLPPPGYIDIVFDDA